MELLKLSKFKLQLQALVTEAQGLRERESSASQHCHLLIQRQKQTEDEYGRRLQELQAELAASNELRQKLERKVNYLENDNVLLENKQKELKGTLQSLLQSREGFLNAYQERTCEMKRAIEARDRKINVLLEKINSHLSLFDSIEKEALCVKEVVDNVQRALSEKEEVVAGLRSKMDKISTFEEVIVDKLRNWENKLKQNADELQRKDRIISELDAQLEAAKISNGCQTPMEDLQKNLLAKDALVQNLTAEKEALYCEVGSLTTILQKIQETVMNMNKEDKREFSSVLEYQEDCNMVAVAAVRVTGGQDVIQRSEISPHNASNADVAEHQGEEHNRVGSPLQDINQVNPCVLEFTYSPPLSPCSELQTTANDPSISVTNEKLNSTITQRHLDSECSTSQAESSEDPG